MSVLLLAVAGLGLASASSLGVTSVLGVTEGASPCSGTAVGRPVGATDVQAGDPGYGAIDVTLPSGCTGARTVQVTLLDGTQSLVAASGTVTGSGSLSASAYRAQSVTGGVATVDGWDLPFTWDFTPPATCQVTSGSGTCVATVTLWTGQRTGGSSSALYFDVWVTTTSSSWVSWQVTFDLSSSYYGTTVTRLGNSDLDSYSDSSTSWSQYG